jgi:hypothetical protein
MLPIDAHRPRDTADQTDPIIFEALIEPFRTLPRQLVLDEEPATKRKEKGDGHNRDWAPHAGQCGHQGNPGLGAGGHVDVVIADADLGDQAKPMVGRDALSLK